MDTMNAVDLNYEYFIKNKVELKKKYPNMYLVIANGNVVTAVSSISEAIGQVKGLQPGTYIIQKCEIDDEKSIQTFHTRVRFNV